MLSLSSAGVGIVAVAATLGAAVHFEKAPRSDTRIHSAMLQDPQSGLGFVLPGPVLDHGVNRTAKGDRLAIPQAASTYRTVPMTATSLPDTVVLVRLPVAANDAATPRPPAARPQPEGAVPKPLVACEPIASILTEAGRSGMTGRCVT